MQQEGREQEEEDNLRARGSGGGGGLPARTSGGRALHVPGRRCLAVPWRRRERHGDACIASPPRRHSSPAAERTWTHQSFVLFCFVLFFLFCFVLFCLFEWGRGRGAVMSGGGGGTSGGMVNRSNFSLNRMTEPSIPCKT